MFEVAWSTSPSQNLISIPIAINEEEIKEINKSIDGFFLDSVNMTWFTFKKFYNTLITISVELYSVQYNNNIIF